MINTFCRCAVINGETIHIFQYILGLFFIEQLIAEEVVKLYDEWVYATSSVKVEKKLQNLDLSVYRDSDIPSKLPDDLKFSP